MPTSRLTLLALTTAALTLVAAAGRAQQAGPPLSADERRCAGMGGANAEVQAAACTTLLGSGRYVGDNLAIVHSNRGIAYARAGDYDRAVGEFDTAVRVNPNYARAYLSRGNAHLVRRDYDRAIS